jgi:hypothetical protein
MGYGFQISVFLCNRRWLVWLCAVTACNKQLPKEINAGNQALPLNILPDTQW